MNNQVTIETLKANYPDACYEQLREAVDMAIYAPEKQIPKKPDMIQTDYDANIWHLYCPSCKDWIGIWNGRLKRMDMRNILNGNICPYCGRVIDCTWVE